MSFDHAFVVLAVAVQCVVFLRWLYRRIRNDELLRAFVHDMATNHLPHIYEALRRIARKQGVELEDSPSIRWIDLNEASRKDGS